VGDVMFEVMLLKAELRGINVESFPEKRAHVTHGFFALAEANEVQDLRRVRECVLNLLGEIGVAVLADGYMLDVGNLCADGVKARFNGKCGKAAKMFVTVQTLLGDSEFHLAV
jgi:hypothetical protein